MSKPTAGLNTRHAPPHVGATTATLGIDLASQAKLTAACVIEWTPAHAEIRVLRAGVDDAGIIQLARDRAVTKVGIDAPFGWPQMFVDAVSSYMASGSWPATAPQELAFRTTDRYVREITGRLPLSVSADRIAYTAMRCASLLTKLAKGKRVDRTGRGLAAEVYPAAALRQWELAATGYKGPGEDQKRARAELIRGARSATAAWLHITDSQLAQLDENDHLLDAFLAAMIARAAAVGLALPIPREHWAAAEAEGWIQLPRAQAISSFRPW